MRDESERMTHSRIEGGGWMVMSAQEDGEGVKHKSMQEEEENKQ